LTLAPEPSYAEGISRNSLRTHPWARPVDAYRRGDRPKVRADQSTALITMCAGEPFSTGTIIERI
jgi:hypothetical protein